MAGTAKKIRSDLVQDSAKSSPVDANDIKSATADHYQMFIQPQNMSEHLAWETLKMQISDNESERELRKNHAGKSFIFTVVWASFIGLLILLKGFQLIQLDRVEFLSVIGALTTSVFGFYLLVMKFLFTRNDKTQSK